MRKFLSILNVYKWPILAGSFLILLSSPVSVFGAEAAVETSSPIGIWISLGILFVAILFFVTEWLPLPLVSLMVPVALVIFNVLPFSKAFAGFSNQWVILFMMMFVVGDSLFRVGLADKIGHWVIKAAHGNEMLIIIYVAIAGGIMSAFMNNTGTAACFIPIMLAISKVSKISPRKIILPMVFGVSLGGMLTLVGTPPNGIVQDALYQATNGKVMFGFFQFGYISIFVFLAGILFMATFGRKILNSIAKRPISNKYVTVTDETQVPAITRANKMWVAIVVFCIVIFMMMMQPMWIKIFASRPEIGKFMTEIPLALWATVGFILILITKTMSIKEAFESIDLGTIFLFAGMLSMGVALNETGAAKLIAENIVKFTGQSPYGAMIGLIIACMIIGNFMSHTATAALFAPIAIQMSNSMHILPTTFLMAVGLAVSTCIVTPVSTPPNTLAVAPGDYIFKDYFKLGWPIQLMAAIILIVLIPVFIPFTPLIP